MWIQKAYMQNAQGREPGDGPESQKRPKKFGTQDVGAGERYVQETGRGSCGSIFKMGVEVLKEGEEKNKKAIERKEADKGCRAGNRVIMGVGNQREEGRHSVLSDC